MISFLERTILHCDMNNFYASVETLFHPEWRGLPLAVCGDQNLRHGIVLAKSEAAKRCGVKTGDAIWQAREKCPELTITPPHFERYVKYSRLAKEIYCEYTDLVEPFGMDECWLDVTGSRRAFGTGTEIGNRLRERMKAELGLSISVGVSFNKTFAKLGSDRKKPDGLTEITRENMPRIVFPLPVEELFGVGGKGKEILHRFGIHTIGDLARADPYFLQLKFGKNGATLRARANGEDPSPVIPGELAPPMQSVGHGLTVKSNLESGEEVWLLILSLTRSIGETLRQNKMLAGGIALECKTASFSVRSLQKKLEIPTDCTMTLAREAYSLFRERYPFREPLRAVTVRAVSLESSGAAVQLSLLDAGDLLRDQILDRASDAICRRWGKNAVTQASLLHRPLPEEADYVPFHAP